MAASKTLSETPSLPRRPPSTRVAPLLLPLLLLASLALLCVSVAAGCDDSSTRKNNQTPNAAPADGSSSDDSSGPGPVAVVIELKPGAAPGQPAVTVGGKPAAAGRALNDAVDEAVKAAPAAGRSAAAPVKILADPATPYADFQLALLAATKAGVTEVDVSLAGGETTRVTIPAAPPAGGGGRRRLDLHIGRGTDGRGVAKVSGGAAGSTGQTDDLRKGLKALLKKEKPSLGGDGAVSITPQAAVPVGDVITAYRTCLELELPNVGFTSN